MNFPPPFSSHEEHTKDKSDQGTDLVPKMMLERTWWNCSTDRGARVKLFGTEFGTNSNSCAAAALKISSQFLTTRLAQSVPVPWNNPVMFPIVFHMEQITVPSLIALADVKWNQDKCDADSTNIDFSSDKKKILAAGANDPDIRPSRTHRIIPRTEQDDRVTDWNVSFSVEPSISPA